MDSFLDLPSEIRNSVYDRLLTGSTPTLGLLATSKQLHEEAASYFYQHNVFTIDLTAEDTTCVRRLSLVPDRYAKYLRHLTVNICVTGFKAAQFTERLTTLAWQDTTLSILSLNLSSTTSRLLSLRTDDSVLCEEHPLTLALQHILSSGAVQLVRVNLDAVWFAPGLATKLLSEFKGKLEVTTAAGGLERGLLGQARQIYAQDLGLNDEDVESLRALPSSPDTAPSTPESLRSALLELDQFSPTEFFDEFEKECGGEKKEHEVASVFVSQELEMQDVNDQREEEEELIEEDDIGDEDMEDIDSLEAILSHSQDVSYWRANEADVYYATNFAPEMLGRWMEERS